MKSLKLRIVARVKIDEQFRKGIYSYRICRPVIVDKKVVAGQYRVEESMPSLPDAPKKMLEMSERQIVALKRERQKQPSVRLDNVRNWYGSSKRPSRPRLQPAILFRARVMMG